MVLVTFVGLVVVAIFAGWSDVRTATIPNVLTLGSASFALVVRAMEGGAALGSGLLGLAIAFLIASPLFLIGAMGGGDVKLLAAVGAFLGTERLAIGLLAIAVMGGVVALILAIGHGRMVETLGRVARLPDQLVRKGAGQRRTVGSSDAFTIPYAVPIGLGAVAGWLIHAGM